MRLLKKLLAIFLSLFSCVMTSPGQPFAKQKTDKNKPDAENQSQRANFTKDELISELNKLSNNAGSIRIVTAMCYSSSVVQGDVDYSCPFCKRNTVYRIDSNQGRLISALPYIQRSFSTLPYKVSVDSSALCRACGKGKPKLLIIHLACFECGEDIAWKIAKDADFQMLQWLYLKPPFRELDGNNLSISGDVAAKEAGIREGIAYIRDHVFCPLHRGGILGNPNVQK